jgi:small subunit ribosomal protein S16
MLAIKLQRVGKKHQPSYRVVVASKRSKLGGPPVEDLGSYSTLTKQTALKKERIEHWLKQGAQPTATVHNLLVKEGVISGKKMTIKMKARKKEAAPAEAVSAAA